jgi:hypothetical protein
MVRQFAHFGWWLSMVWLGTAGTTAPVEVTAAPPLLTTTNATLVGLVNGQQVSTLSLNGRDMTELILLQPGANTRG